jgi:hypothetical protein
MNSIRRTGTALALAVAFSVPTLASAEQASELCDGSKAEHKEPTADRSKQNTSSDQKSDDKTNQKPDDSNKKSEPNQSGKTS